MYPDHLAIEQGFNPSPKPGELTVLFSGKGQPVGLHGIGPAVHDYFLIHTVLSGTGEFVQRGIRRECGEGDTFVIFPGELFSYRADERDPWRYVWIALVGSEVQTILDSLGFAPERPIAPNAATRRALDFYERIRDCYSASETPELANLEAEGLTRLLLLEFGVANRAASAGDSRPDSAGDRVVKQAIQYMTHQYTQPISIERMSAMFGYHRTHLCKLFKQATGASPVQYLFKVRMERAEQLLDTPMTVDQVASSVGFGDALYFSKKFKKWTGLSPSEYRKAPRNGRGADRSPSL